MNLLTFIASDFQSEDCQSVGKSNHIYFKKYFGQSNNWIRFYGTVKKKKVQGQDQTTLQFYQGFLPKIVNMVREGFKN